MELKKISLIILFLLLLSFFAPKAQAGYLTHISDTISTAAPSTLSPLEIVTATHVVKFTTASTIPVGGRIVISFYGAGDNSSTPSATTFAFNNLQVSNISASFSMGASTCSFTVSAPTITCVINTSAVSPETVITITVGSVSPALINPTKSATTGTADLWKMFIQTWGNSSNKLDSARATIGTIDSVQIQATLEPTLTFTIAPVSGVINNGNKTGCTNTESVNSGIASTTTTVNLGLLKPSKINISAQLLTVTTNSTNGYVLTATSSGHLRNPANGAFVKDGTTPTTMTIGNPWFGIHPCGLNVNSTTWGTGPTGSGKNAKYAWPTTTTALNLASAATGPIGNSASTGGVGAGLTSVEYAATIDNSVPAGAYTTSVTYTATPTF